MRGRWAKRQLITWARGLVASQRARRRILLVVGWALVAAVVVGALLLVWRGPWWLDADHLQGKGPMPGQAALATGFRTAVVQLLAVLGAGIALLFTASNYRFLARQIMAKGHYSRVGRHIRLSDLQAELDLLRDQSAAYVRASWQWGGGHKVDSDDVRWLGRHLHHVQGDTLANPRPAADQTNPAPRFFWQTYSPALTRSITADVLRDALLGYRDLVELNFPRFGAALGLYSVFPIRVEGLVTMPPDGSYSDPAMVTYALRPDTTSAPQDQPTVDLRLSDESPLPEESLWAKVREDRSTTFRVPGMIQQETLLPYHDRQATNLAYRWLAKDLQAVGWLERAVTFPE